MALGPKFRSGLILFEWSEAHSYILPCPTPCFTELTEMLILKKTNIIKLWHYSVGKNQGYESTEDHQKNEAVKDASSCGWGNEPNSRTQASSPTKKFPGVLQQSEKHSLKARELLVISNQREEQVLC